MLEKRRVPVGDFKVSEAIKKAVMDVLDSGRISEWKRTSEFEKAFSNYVGTKHCVATSSGTSALLLGLLALKYDTRFPKIKTGTKVITSPVTYISTTSAIVLSGLEPVFVDIDLQTFKLLPDAVEKAIKEHGEENIGLILPVHLMGYPNDMETLLEIGYRYNLPVFEDSAQAHGSFYQGKRTGSLGLLAIFSFYIAHNIQVGEMGCVTTSDAHLFRLLKQLKANGRACKCRDCSRFTSGCVNYRTDAEIGDPRFLHEYVGYNFKTMEFQSAIGLVQLKQADKIFKQRIKNVSYLNENLADLEDIFILPLLDKNVSYLAYPLVLKEGGSLTRGQVAKYLEENGVENRPLFGCLPTQQPALQKEFSSLYKDKLKNAQFVGRNALYIGCHQYLSEEDLAYVVQVFKGLKKGLNVLEKV